MLTKLQATKRLRISDFGMRIGKTIARILNSAIRNPKSAITTAFLALLIFTTGVAQAQNPAPSPSSTPQPAPPAGTQTQGQQPGQPPPSRTQLPPNSSTAPVRPDNEAQQSAQPQTGIEQERQQTTPNTGGPRPIQPPEHRAESRLRNCRPGLRRSRRISVRPRAPCPAPSASAWTCPTRCRSP